MVAHLALLMLRDGLVDLRLKVEVAESVVVHGRLQPDAQPRALIAQHQG